eukprot:GFUD01047150.1.p1 GENE.GFUD01047150.1~~GFUD01047150.1.p1  ORF type:complete len:228 (+),score=22.23 GFUD01047150.1:73-756(+)
MVPYWFLALIFKLAAETGAAAKTMTEPERPERPERPGRPERPESPKECLYEPTDRVIGNCVRYGIDYNPGGDCDIKTMQNIQNPYQCSIKCLPVNQFAAWSWIVLDGNPPNPGQCVCKNCTGPIKTDNYVVAGLRDCRPYSNSDSWFYGQLWCDIEDTSSCKFELHPNFRRPELCERCCRATASNQGFSWGNNQANNPGQAKCYCFTSSYKPPSSYPKDFFYLSGKV